MTQINMDGLGADVRRGLPRQTLDLSPARIFKAPTFLYKLLITIINY